MNRAIKFIIAIYIIAFCISCGNANKSAETKQEEKTPSGKEQIDNRFKSVTINKLEWMSENFNEIKFKNGDVIPEAKTEEEWIKAAKDGKPCWCNYKNDEENGKKFGKLYNWYAINDSRGLAPKGWHIASDEELKSLIDISGGKDSAGDKLKEAGTANWKIPNKGADNSSNFTALPSGYRSAAAEFKGLRTSASFWTSKEYDAKDAWRYALNNDDAHVDRSIRDKGFGFSVRCIKD